MSRRKITYVVDLLLTATVVFFLSSPGHATQGWFHKPLKAERLLLNRDYFYEQKKPIPYLDIQISQYLNPWTQFFDVLRRQAEVNRLDAQIMTNNRNKDLQQGAGMALIIFGVIVVMAAHEAYLKFKKGLPI